MSIICLNGKRFSTIARLKAATAFGIIGGAANLFLAIMLWFIIDNDKQPLIYFEDARAYPVLNVVKQNHSSVNLDLDYDYEKEEIENNKSVSFNSSFKVGERMIAQFFTESYLFQTDW